MPTSCHTTITDTANDAIITNEARPPDTVFGSRRPKNALTTKPAKGKSGINASNPSPFECCEGIGVERFPMAEQRDDERQPDGGFGGRHRHDEERDDLPVDIAGIPTEGDETQIHRI